LQRGGNSNLNVKNYRNNEIKPTNPKRQFKTNTTKPSKPIGNGLSRIERLSHYFWLIIRLKVRNTGNKEKMKNELGSD
jgi:hypothetical protein